MTDTNDIKGAYWQNNEWHTEDQPLKDSVMSECEALINKIMPRLDIQGKKELSELASKIKIKAVINEQDEQNKAA